jgi:glycosyltransferase involved in cell wall biosynthesis
VAAASIRIESVLNQTYSKFEYLIVNNCSTDRTLHIAQTYAKQDPRVRVVTNKGFVSAAQNHNNAVREISPQSDYCKVVSADDYLFSSALSTLVGFAVEHPSVGIINFYQQSRDSILWKGLSESVTVMSGREACRTELLDRTPLFGTPTSLKKAVATRDARGQSFARWYYIDIHKAPCERRRHGGSDLQYSRRTHIYEFPWRA